MTDIFFIRHAESEMNAKEDMIGGRSNHVHLTDTGKNQSIKLGNRLKAENAVFDHCYISPAERTKETAAIVLHFMQSQVDVTFDDRIQELSQGDWEGLPRARIYTPERLALIQKDNWNFKAPNGESQREVETRMLEFADEIAHKHPDQKIAVFTHGMAIKCLLGGVMAWDTRQTYRTAIENTSLSVLRHDGQWSLRRVNDHAHIL